MANLDLPDAVADTDIDDAALPAELEPLKNTLREIALGPTLEGEHTRPGAMLYHYTGETGMRGILNSGTLWATRLNFIAPAVPSSAAQLLGRSANTLNSTKNIAA